MLESLNSNFACGNRCTRVILLLIGPQQSLLMIFKWIWDLNLFPSSLKASASNFRIFFVGSLVFNLRFKKFPNHRFFSDSAENPVNTHRWQIWIDLIHLPTLFVDKPRKIVNEVNLKFRFYSEKLQLFCCKPCYQMFDLFFIFSALFLRTESRGKAFYWAALRMQKIAADEVNIMECDPESTSVTSKFFSKIRLSTLLRTDHGILRKICGLEVFI